MDGKPALEVASHHSDVGWWEMVSRPPAERLRRHVLGYCGYEEETRSFTRRRELPSGEVVVILGFGPELEMTYPGDVSGRGTKARSFVAGLHDTHCFVDTPGSQSGVQVNMTPLGAYLLFGVPMHELSNRIVAVGDLLGNPGQLLCRQLHDAQGWAARFELLDRILLSRFAGARPGSPDVAWAWNELVRCGGQPSVTALCGQIGCSRKHLARRFNEQIGLPPKAVASVLRFQRAAQMLGHRDGASQVGMNGRGEDQAASWGEIALDCGYFDQAHMNREFRRLAGVSPSALSAAKLPDAGGLAG